MNNPIEGSKQPFSINAKFYKKQRLIFSQQLLRLGGDREILRAIQVKTSRELLKAQNELEEKDKIIKELKQKIEELEDLLKNK